MTSDQIERRAAELSADAAVETTGYWPDDEKVIKAALVAIAREAAGAAGDRIRDLESQGIEQAAEVNRLRKLIEWASGYLNCLVIRIAKHGRKCCEGEVCFKDEPFALMEALGIELGESNGK